MASLVIKEVHTIIGRPDRVSYMHRVGQNGDSDFRWRIGTVFIKRIIAKKSLWPFLGRLYIFPQIDGALNYR
jgi:hypothetical protein